MTIGNRSQKYHASEYYVKLKIGFFDPERTSFNIIQNLPGEIATFYPLTLHNN